MILKSNDLKVNQIIKTTFTCDGENISPHLYWSGFPENTKSFALMLINKDSEIGILGHWYVINIPKDITEILRGANVPGIVIENDFGNLFYDGPCPKNGINHYAFQIFALTQEKIEGVDKTNFRKFMRNNSLDSAELSFKYKRKFDFKQFRFNSCHSCN
ncbi:MAG: YbhB/YbcL family Raf kinase inhibitor-like protein [Candidatus Lokiarchaeota archaeon]